MPEEVLKSSAVSDAYR